jgi:tRNA wybutosine-synthesizing protein 2
MSDEGGRLTIKVSKPRAEEVRGIVMRHHLFDPDRSIGRDAGYVHIPILVVRGSGTIDEIMRRFGEDVTIEPEGSMTGMRDRRAPPISEIRERLRYEIGPDLIGSLPNRWELFGDGLVLKLTGEFDPFLQVVSSAYASVLGARFVLVDMSGISGELREPDMVMTVPPPDGCTEVVHSEGGIRYRFDPQRIMFSSGNVGERTSAASLTRTVPLGRTPSGPLGREIVYDMFAGIGYFSLPLSKGDPDALVISCEKNPASYGYLLENIALNDLEGRVLPVLGDCRKALPEGCADRIVMGYIGGTMDYLGAGLRCLSSLGGIVHFHDTVKVEEGAEGLFRRVRSAVRGSGRDVLLIRKRKVKSYAPRTDHIVLDLAVGPKGA